MAQREAGSRYGIPVVLIHGHFLDPPSLRTWAQKLLAPYKVPSRVLLLDALPGNAMGKVIKPSLVELVHPRASKIPTPIQSITGFPVLRPIALYSFTAPPEREQLAAPPIHSSIDVHEANTRHLVGLRLLPFLFVLYIVNYVDRTNLAYAAVGMSRTLGFSDRVFGFGAGIFFISYLALQIPGARLVARLGARRVISSCMIAWGTLTVLTALVHTPMQLYLARFVLGAAEASFFPGVIVYFSYWFINEDRAKATSNFMSAIPLSSMLGSPLAGWILGRTWLRVDGWRWLFVVEGLPAIVLGVIAYFFLTDRPADATWLHPGGRDWLLRTLEEESPTRSAKASFRDALQSPLICFLAALTFLAYVAQYTFVFWFPLMFKRLSGMTDLHVGLWGAVPFLWSFLLMQINGWHSDKMAERRWHAAIPLFVSSAGFLLLTTRPQGFPMLLTFFIMASIAPVYLPTFWAIPPEILSPTIVATAVGLINSVGSIAGFAAPYAFGYLQAITGSLNAGLILTALCSLTAGLLILRIPKCPE
jgi:MFS transporter, ACS family, tartrate transporter